MKKTICLILFLIGAAPLLAACSASCDCPHCPTSSTTVVTPGHSTVVTPND